MDHIIIGNKQDEVGIHGKPCYDKSIINFNDRYKYYWISIGVFGLESCIYGNSVSIIVNSGTEEYDKLTELVKTKDNDIIEAYANQLVIKYSDPEEIYKMIERVKDMKYKQGRHDVQYEFKAALGLYHSRS